MQITSFTLSPTSGPAGTPITATVVVQPDGQVPPMTLTLQAVVQQGGVQAEADGTFQLTFPPPAGVTVQLIDVDSAGFSIGAPQTNGNTTVFAVIAPGA